MEGLELENPPDCHPAPGAQTKVAYELFSLAHDRFGVLFAGLGARGVWRRRARRARPRTRNGAIPLAPVDGAFYPRPAGPREMVTGS